MHSGDLFVVIYGCGYLTIAFFGIRWLCGLIISGKKAG